MKLPLVLAASLVAPLCISGLAFAAPATKTANAPFAWRLNLRPGQKWLTTTDSTMEMNMTMPTMPNGSKMPAVRSIVAQHQTFEQKVLSSSGKGARIEMTYRSMTQRIRSLQGNQVVYDSAHPTGALKNIPDVSNALVGVRLSYLLSPTGQVSDVRGTQEYQKRINTALQKAFVGKSSSPKVPTSMFSSALSPQTMAAGLSTSYLAMPKTTVTRGQSWNYATMLPMMGIALSLKGHSTFLSRSGNVVTIAQTGALTTSQTAPTGNSPQMSIPMPKVDMKGTSTGQVQVDELTGLTLLNRSTQVMRSQTTVANPKKKGQSMSFPMQFKLQTIIRTQKSN